MNAQAEAKTVIPGISLELDPELDPPKLEEDFRRTGRVRIRNFLQPASAEAIYQHLAHDIPWRTFVVSNERLMATPSSEHTGATVDEEKEVIDCAYEGARSSFACLFDADHLHPEDMEEGDIRADRDPPCSPILVAVNEFLASTAVVDLLRRVTGLSDIDHIHAHAMRFRQGHFVMFHSATWSADRTTKRRASFYVNLTPEWKPEWGGMIELRTADADIVEAFVPTFNTLDILAFPQGYWISPIAPFAAGPMLALSGRIYGP